MHKHRPKYRSISKAKREFGDIFYEKNVKNLHEKFVLLTGLFDKFAGI